MRLVAVTVGYYRNFVDPQRIEIESDVTCLVGKNESGKTTILKALHRLKPANETDGTFDLTTEYPRWRLARDRRSNPNLSEVRPVVAEFSLNEEDRSALADSFEFEIPEAAVLRASRDYENSYSAELTCSLRDLLQEAVSAAEVDAEDLEGLDSEGSIADLTSGIRSRAKEHKEAGDNPKAKALTTLAANIDRKAVLLQPGESSEDQRQALWDRVPCFFYFSSYNTLPGEINLTQLAKKMDGGEALNARERTTVSLLGHAGETPADFLDENYDSRKAELQSASIDLSRQVFKYWKQNPDLTVVFDTDNRVVRTTPEGNAVAHRFLKVELRDGRHGDVETNFDTRSSGFQWFFSFFAAFSEFQDSTEDVVVLLDEPGTSLHGEAQNEFVDYIFNELGSSQQTIYTTHSQHMVDPTRYEKLRAVHDRATRQDPDLGVVVTLPSLSADRATILPIESALGYSVSRHLFLGSGQHLAVEGSSDFVFLQRLTEILVAAGRTGLSSELSVIPVGGADNMPAFVALLGRRLKVSALIDGARSGSRYERVLGAARNNGVPDSAVVLCSDVDGLPKNADIEDLFAVKDYLQLYNWAFSAQIQVEDLPPGGPPILKRLMDLRGSDFDHAQPAHALTHRKADFLATVDARSLDNFEALFLKLNATLEN